jgi:hypothetical protein
MNDPLGLFAKDAPAKLEMQQALGLALSRWGHIEGSLALVFMHAVTATRSESASAAFFAIRSFEVQIEVVSATVEMTFRNAPELLADWKRFKHRLEKLRPKRNKLAHGQIVQTKTGGRPAVIRFVPFFSITHHKDLSGFEQWDVAEVQRLAEAFSELRVDLFKFAGGLNYRQAPRG